MMWAGRRRAPSFCSSHASLLLLLEAASFRWAPARAQEVVLPGPSGGVVPMFTPKEMPGPGFPGKTAEESNKAWPSGEQPYDLGAWPQSGFNTHDRKLNPCWKKTVLHDHERGWPGLCMSLFHTNISLEAHCQQVCHHEPRCPVWQFVNQTTPGQCWVGFGEDCLTRGGNHDDISVQGAQRVMHGEVRVLMNLSGWKIHHLTNIDVYHHGDEELNILRCKAWCYSTIQCQYWQYGPTGCWVDSPVGNRGNPAERVPYPLTISPDGAERFTEEAVTMHWGEYIQHYCPHPDETSSPEHFATLGSRSGGGTAPFPPLWLLVPLVLGLIICALAYMLHAKSSESGRKTSGSSSGKLRGGAKRKMQRSEAYEDDSYGNEPLAQVSDAGRPSREVQVKPAWAGIADYENLAQELPPVTAQTQLLSQDNFGQWPAEARAPMVIAGNTFDMKPMPRGDSVAAYVQHAAFEAIDRNHDGAISRPEWAMAAGPQGHARVPSGPYSAPGFPQPGPGPSAGYWHAAPGAQLGATAISMPRVPTARNY